jgi:Glycosyl transferase family 11
VEGIKMPESGVFKVNLIGGVGNQLFQLANAANLSCTRNHTFFLSKTKRNRDFALNWWGLKLDQAYSFSENKLISSPVKLSQKWFYKNNFIYENHEYVEIPRLLDRTSVTGYFQSLNYFAEIEKPLKVFLTEKFSSANIKSPKNDSVLIHVRLGDYLNPINQNRFYTVTDEYINKALEMLKPLSSWKTIEVITDDIRNFNLLLPKTAAQTSIIHNLNSKDSFELLVKAPNKIISNSTFSWWAAWVGGGNVIAPHNWFKEDSGLKIIPKEFFPSDWLIA